MAISYSIVLSILFWHSLSPSSLSLSLSLTRQHTYWVSHLPLAELVSMNNVSVRAGPPVRFQWACVNLAKSFLLAQQSPPMVIPTTYVHKGMALAACPAGWPACLDVCLTSRSQFNAQLISWRRRRHFSLSLFLSLSLSLSHVITNEQEKRRRLDWVMARGVTLREMMGTTTGRVNCAAPLYD
jgi:hypothetical protein